MSKITFGRSKDCDIVFDENIVSRQHGYLLITGNKVFIVDNNSKNGIYVNGERITGRALLSYGDEVMIAKKKTLSELAAPLVIYPQVLKNIRVTDKTKAQDDADVKAAVSTVAESLGSNGRILVRESGTEPVVRVMVEAGSIEECERYVDQVIDVIKSKGYVI